MSVPVIKRLLDRHGFRRKAQKSTAMGRHPDQDARFRNIARLKDEFWASPSPIRSMDGKKKKLIDLFFRSGRLYSKEVVEVFDHDFPSFTRGVVIPHGLYDLKNNVGHNHLGTRHGTKAGAHNFAGWVVWRDHTRLAILGSLLVFGPPHASLRRMALASD